MLVIDYSAGRLALGVRRGFRFLLALADVAFGKREFAKLGIECAAGMCKVAVSDCTGDVTGVGIVSLEGFPPVLAVKIGKESRVAFRERAGDEIGRAHV